MKDGQTEEFQRTTENEFWVCAGPLVQLGPRPDLTGLYRGLNSDSKLKLIPVLTVFCRGGG